MASISVGHQVYLYRLFVREIGVGRQTPIARVEEVLVADDVLPCDLGCADTRELLEKLSDFVRLTVFKKGRVYVTVAAQPAWDEALARADKEDSAKRPADKGAKTWKRRRNRGEIQPLRPRPKNRPKPVEIVEVIETVEDVAAVEAVDVVEEQAEKPVEKPAAESAPKTNEPVEAVPAPDDKAAQSEGATENEGATAGAAAVPGVEAIPGAEAAAGAEAVMGEEATPGEEAAPDARAAIEQKPYDQSKSHATIAEGSQAASGNKSKSATTANSAQESAADLAEKTPAEAVVTSAPTASQELDAMAEPIGTPTPKETLEASATPEPLSAPEADAASKPTAAPAPTAAPVPTTSQQEHPQNFAEQVQVGNEQLSALYQVLPLDVDPMELLDEDWRVARSTSSFETRDGVVTFPLRYVRTSDGQPVRVSMKRGVAGASGKRWAITNVEGELNVALDGLPVSGIDATRELAQFAVLGPWDALVAKLDALRAPAFGPTDDELQEYLSITFHRVRLENKLVTYANESRLVFDTGLLTTGAQSILMCFANRPGDIAWEFVDFCVADRTAQDVPVPEPAQYLTSLADVTISSEADVYVRRQLVNTYGQRLEDAAQTALRRVRRDYRLGTPAYDPVTNQLRLLVPLCLGDKDRADHALVLVPSNDKHAFVASAVLSLERAATCARVVSLELPRWLTPANA